MAKVNLQTLRRPERPAATRAFTDPEQPGVEVELTLRGLDAYSMTLAVEAAQKLAATFDENCYPLENGELVRITPGVAQTLCALEMMQAGPEADRYGVGDLLALMVNMPSAWASVLEWVSRLNAAAEAQAGN